MNVYLAIISGAIKLFNSIADGLRQYHDEVNGANKQKVADAEAQKQTLDALTAPISSADADELWKSNQARFGTATGPVDR